TPNSRAIESKSASARSKAFFSSSRRSTHCSKAQTLPHPPHPAPQSADERSSPSPDHPRSSPRSRCCAKSTANCDGYAIPDHADAPSASAKAPPAQSRETQTDAEAQAQSDTAQSPALPSEKKSAHKAAAPPESAAPALAPRAKQNRSERSCR